MWELRNIQLDPSTLGEMKTEANVSHQSKYKIAQKAMKTSAKLVGKFQRYWSKDKDASFAFASPDEFLRTVLSGANEEKHFSKPRFTWGLFPQDEEGLYRFALTQTGAD